MKRSQSQRNSQRVISGAFLTCIILPILSVSVSAQIETSGFPVVQLDESARVAALGGRSPALATDDVGAVFSNPAMLSVGSRNKLSLSYLNHIGSLNAAWLSYARGLDSLTTAAIGIRYLGFGSFDRTDDQGAANGTFNASDLSLTIGGSRRFRDQINFGVNVHYLLSSIDGFHSSALSMDAGVFYTVKSGFTTLGATIHHAGFVLSSFGKRNDTIPFDIRLGFTKKLEHVPLLLSVTAYRLHRLDGGLEDESTLSNALYHLIFGFEFLLSESFQIRFGYNHRRHDELRLKSRLDLAGYSIGTGIKLSRITVDYAFNSWSTLGGLHRFSVQTSL